MVAKRKKLKLVNFKIDAETLAEFEAMIKPERKSDVIRALITVHIEALKAGK